MKMTVEALKTLYVKLGGSLTDTYADIADGIPVSEYTLTPDCIEACAKKASSGGTDNFIVTFSTTEEQGVTKYIADKTVKQIYEARMDGKNVKAVMDNGTFETELILTAFSGSLACFSTVILDSEESSVLTISALGMGGGESIEDDTWEVADSNP